MWVRDLQEDLREAGRQPAPGLRVRHARLPEEKGLVVEVEGAQASARRKRVYAISDQGKEFLVRHAERLDSIISLLKDVKGAAEGLASRPGGERLPSAPT